MFDLLDDVLDATLGVGKKSCQESDSKNRKEIG